VKIVTIASKCSLLTESSGTHLVPLAMAMRNSIVLQVWQYLLVVRCWYVNRMDIVCKYLDE
jgi:hypothetical protein